MIWLDFKHWISLHEYGHFVGHHQLNNCIIDLSLGDNKKYSNLEEEIECDKVADKMNPKIDSAEILKKIYRNYKTNGKAIYSSNNDYLNVLNGFVERIR